MKGGGECGARVAELVDDRDAVAGGAGEGRGEAEVLAGDRGARGVEVREAHDGVSGAEALDDEAIVEVAAGGLLEVAVDGEGDGRDLGGQLCAPLSSGAIVAPRTGAR